MIVGVTGRRGAGKSEAAMLLRQQGFEIVEMGAILRQMMVDRDIEPEEYNIMAFILDIRAELGEEVLAIETMNKVSRLRSSRIAIVGIRTPAEMSFFRKQFGNGMTTIAIRADDRTRFDRVRNRGGIDDPKTRYDFMEYKNKIESKLEVEKVMKSADYTVKYSKNMDDMRRQIASILDEIAVEEEPQRSPGLLSRLSAVFD